MPIFKHCVKQIDRYSFKLTDTTAQQNYDRTGIDITNITSASLTLINKFDGNNITIDILDKWVYILGEGAVFNIMDMFPNGEMVINIGGSSIGFDYFPDWLYDTIVKYTYEGTEYEDCMTTGFKYLIAKKVNHQTLQSDWKKELDCGCGCNNPTATLRKYHWLMMLKFVADACLEDEWIETLLKLYKLTGIKHEYIT